MSVDIKNTSIEITVPVKGQFGVEYEGYTIGKQDEFLDPRLFGIPFRDPNALPSIIGTLRSRVGGLDNGRRKFAGDLADSLNRVVVASQVWPPED